MTQVSFSDNEFIDYKYKTKPFKHQWDVFKTSRDEEYYALFMEQGTGKSKVIVDTITHLARKGSIDSAVIVAPKGVYRNWLKQEIPIHMPDDVLDSIYMELWNPTETKKNIERLTEFMKSNHNGLKVFIINIEAFSTLKGLHYTQRFLNVHKSMVVIDESSTIKHKTARRTKNLLKLANMAKYRRILTGTPVTAGPIDIYTQMSFLSDNILQSSFYGFRNRYCVLRRRTINMRTFDEIVDYQNLDELQDIIKPYSYRVTKAECLDLPDKVYTKREIEMTPKQKKVYDILKKKAYIELSEEKSVTAPLVITRLLRLQQIMCGFVKYDDGREEEIDKVNPRITELLQVLEETEGQVIIWSNYTRSIHDIENAIKKYMKNKTCATYYGDTKSEDRQEIVTQFQAGEIDYFIGQPRTGGYGLTLTNATTVIYYANSYDLEVRLQSEDRPHRIGQTNKVTYIDFVTPKTIDEKIFEALRNKKSLADSITGDNWKEWI